MICASAGGGNARRPGIAAAEAGRIGLPASGIVMSKPLNAYGKSDGKIVKA